MNSDFSDDLDLFQLERELQSLTPAAPRRELVQAIKARMEPVPRRTERSNRVAAFPWRRMVAPAAAAAAAVAVLNIDEERRDGKPPVTSGNDVAPSIKWESMPMLAEYRDYLDKGYFINPHNPNLQLVHPQYRGLFNTPVVRFQDGNDGTMRVSFPQKNKNRFIVPASYGEQTGFLWGQ